MKKKVVAVLLAASLTVVSLAACGGTGQNAAESTAQEEVTQSGASTESVAESENTGETDQTAATEEADTQQASAGSEDSQYLIDPSMECWAPYEDTVTISTVYEDLSTAKYTEEGDDITNNIWTRDYKDKFNIEVETLWSSTEYDTKLNLAIASGQLPDVFKVKAYQLVELMDAGLLMDVSDVVEQYASPRLKACLEADPAAVESGSRDGALYGIPQLGYGDIDDPDYFWIRQDWLANVGLETPETWEEWEAVLYAFTNDDPDGNGVNDTYGFGLNNELEQVKTMAVAFGAHPDIWIKDESGQIVYGSVQEEMKAVLETCAKWYQDGVINPDFVSMDADTLNQDYISGKVGATSYFQHFGFNPGVNLVANNGPESIMLPSEIVSATGEKVIHSIDWGNAEYTVFSKDCKNPEAAIKLINYYCYIVNDANDIDSQIVVDHLSNDLQHVTTAFRVQNPMADVDQYERIFPAFETRDTSSFKTPQEFEKYNGALLWLDNQDSKGVGYYSQMMAYDIGNRIIEAGDVVHDEFHGISTETMTDKETALDAMLTEGFTQIITGARSIDYFDELVQSWENSGGTQMTEEMNATYGE